MLILDKKKRHAEVTIDLGRGASCVARTLEAFESKLIFAQARAEMNALLADTPSQYQWSSMTADRLAKLRTASPEVQHGAITWMNSVLLATESVTSIAGIVDGDGNALTPSFELFELLFTDALVELNFKSKALEIETIWIAEKNVSGPGPGGSGPEASTGAPPAAPPTTPAPAAADAEQTTSSATDAPSAPTPPAPPLANSSGNSPEAVVSGSQQA